ncbi:hypothetical protein JL722_2910 [Aureococcus anophagefferens]|nr:hypothetical protein JL722_2910 [Aureococcus anophagefferens]
MARKKGANAASAPRQQQQPRGWAVPAGVVAVVAVAASVVAARSSAHAIVEEDACDGDDATCWTAAPSAASPRRLRRRRGRAVGVPHFAARALTSYGPSVFVSFGGGGGGLHVDSGATHFWQHVHSGAKSYRVFEAGAWPALFPEDDDWRRAFFRDARCSGIFGEAAAALRDGGGAAPVGAFDDGAAGAAWAGEARAGDVVFVPANFPHQVRNADAVTVAVSMNYVDDTNLALVSEALLQAPAYHPKWLARLNVGGAAVAGPGRPGSRRPRRGARRREAIPGSSRFGATPTSASGSPRRASSSAPRAHSRRTSK